MRGDDTMSTVNAPLGISPAGTNERESKESEAGTAAVVRPSGFVDGVEGSLPGLVYGSG
jgi:hypothetical protein